MSRFLPENFDRTRPIALIAGQGSYPILLAERARKAGIHICLIELGGETSPDLISSFPENQRSAVKVGQVGKLLKELKNFNAGYAVMSGQVTPGKLFRGLHPDLSYPHTGGARSQKCRNYFWSNWGRDRKSGSSSA